GGGDPDNPEPARRILGATPGRHLQSPTRRTRAGDPPGGDLHGYRRVGDRLPGGGGLRPRGGPGTVRSSLLPPDRHDCSGVQPVSASDRSYSSAESSPSGTTGWARMNSNRSSRKNLKVRPPGNL